MDQGACHFTRDGRVLEEVHSPHQLHPTSQTPAGNRAVRESSTGNGAPQGKQISTDKELIKKYLRENIGSDFATCTAYSDDDVLGLDLSSWGGNNHKRENTPWKQTERKMQDYREYVRMHLGRLCPWHHCR